MTIKEFMTSIIVDWNDIFFTYNGQKCGMMSNMHDGEPIFKVWYGDKTKCYNNVNDLMNDRFFEGKTLTELIPLVTIKF